MKICVLVCSISLNGDRHHKLRRHHGHDLHRLGLDRWDDLHLGFLGLAGLSGAALAAVAAHAHAAEDTPGDQEAHQADDGHEDRDAEVGVVREAGGVPAEVVLRVVVVVVLVYAVVHRHLLWHGDGGHRDARGAHHEEEEEDPESEAALLGYHLLVWRWGCFIRRTAIEQSSIM